MNRLPLYFNVQLIKRCSKAGTRYSNYTAIKLRRTGHASVYTLVDLDPFILYLNNLVVILAVATSNFTYVKQVNYHVYVIY